MNALLTKTEHREAERERRADALDRRVETLTSPESDLQRIRLMLKTRTLRRKMQMVIRQENGTRRAHEKLPLKTRLMPEALQSLGYTARTVAQRGAA